MTILVVDDDPLSRKMLNYLLQDEGFKVLEAESIQTARLLIKQQVPSLTLLDLTLPDGDGLDFCEELSQQATSMPIIIVTSQSAPEVKLKGFGYGATDYIVKPYDYRELVGRVRAVLRRVITLPQAQDRLQAGGLELIISELKVKRGQAAQTELTATEMKVLRCLMLNAGEVISRPAIAASAFGPAYSNNSNLVDVYMGRLRKKIEDEPSQPKYIETIVGSGYRLKVN